MSRLTLNITGINGVAAGQPASVKLPNDCRIHGFNLKYSNTASRAGARAATQAEIAADITEIRVMANSKPIRRFSPADNIKVNGLNGIAAVDGWIQHFFSQIKRRTPVGEEFFALSAYGLPGLMLEIDFAAAAAGPALSGFLEYDFVPDTNRAFSLWEKRSVSNPSVGEHDLDDLPRAGAYSRVHLLTDKIERIRVQVDGGDVVDRTPEQNTVLLAPRGFTIQAGTFPVVLDYSQQTTDALDMVRVVDGKPVKVKTFNLKITHAADVASYRVIAERVVENIADYIA